LTIHNLEKQGNYPKIYEKYFTKKNFTYLHLDNINFLKTGIMRANQINTVSKTYKEEILTKFYGFSLDGALKSRQNNLHGIQNGIDFDLYNPNMDGYIYQQYDIKNFKKGKLNNKTNLIKSIGFKDPNKMVVSFISRFANEKGIHLIMESIDKYLENDQIYFLVIGEGDFQFEDYFKTLSDKYPNNCYFVKGHNQEISQNFYAASDIILMPSLYEASGLNQLIALRYGTLPIVRQTGGLTDTVIAYNKETKTGYGFVFENFDDEELSQAIDLSLDTYLNDQDSFNQMIKNGMELNNSIDKMALAYQDLYKLTIK
ncbi:MAG TPA: glycosyltransferase, partial [Haploplasma sp.]|nr:glycosyltransferase [Haploplasma sp.]